MGPASDWIDEHKTKNSSKACAKDYAHQDQHTAATAAGRVRDVLSGGCQGDGNRAVARHRRARSAVESSPAQVQPAARKPGHGAIRLPGNGARPGGSEGRVLARTGRAGSLAECSVVVQAFRPALYAEAFHLR